MILSYPQMCQYIADRANEILFQNYFFHDHAFMMEWKTTQQTPEENSFYILKIMFNMFRKYRFPITAIHIGYITPFQCFFFGGGGLSNMLDNTWRAFNWLTLTPDYSLTLMVSYMLYTFSCTCYRDLSLASSSM